MSALVPDASVAVKWILDEAGSDEAVELLDRAPRLHAPTLLRVEVAAAIVRGFRMNTLSLNDAQTRLSHAERILAEPRVRYVSDNVLLRRANEIALEIKHGVQDCLYIACAERESAELVTADQVLFARATPRFGFVKAL